MKGPGCDDGKMEWSCPEVGIATDLNLGEKKLSMTCGFKGVVTQKKQNPRLVMATHMKELL